MTFQPIKIECPRPDIAAYIDGELAPDDEMALELHFAGCKSCSDELNLQKKFLFALNSTLEQEGEIELPENFTKVVVTSAESRVSGLRRSGERSNAALICGALFLIVILAIGTEVSNVFSGVGQIFDKTVAVFSLAGHLLFNLTMGIVLILKSLAGQFVPGSAVTFLFFAALLALSLFAFSRLMFRYGRPSSGLSNRS